MLRNGPFLRLWLVQLISHTANNSVNFALLLQIRDVVETNQIDQANTVISLVILAFSLPSVIFGPLAGVVADRINRRLVMAIVNAARAVAVVLFLVIQDDWPVPVVLGSFYAVTFVFGAVGQFFPPAEGAVIPALVSRRDLVSANALFNLTFTGSQLLGFAVVGPILAKFVGTDAIFVITGGLFVACAALTMTLPNLKAPPVPPGAETHPMRRLVADVREGLVFIWRDRMLMKAIAYLTLSATTFLMIASLGPAFVSNVIGLSTEDIGYIVAPAGLGVALGVVLVPRLLRRFAREDVIDWAIVCAGAALVLLATSRVVLGVILPGVEISVALETAVAGFFAAAAADYFGVVEVLVVVAIILVAVGLVSLAQRRAGESARWARTRTRHREGPEALTIEDAESLDRVDDRDL